MENNNNSKRKWYILFLIAICIIIVLFTLKFFYPKPTVPSETSPGGQYTTKNDSQMKYDEESIKKSQDLTNNKRPLSAADESAKSVLVKKTNPLAMTDNVTIKYDSGKDEFQAEITSIRINTAKEDAVMWLKSQGISEDGICKLPLIFTIDDRDAESLRGLDIIFNPLPPNCQ